VVTDQIIDDIVACRFQNDCKIAIMICLLRKNHSMRKSRNLKKNPVFHAIAYLSTLSLAPSTATKRIQKGMGKESLLF